MEEIKKEINTETVPEFSEFQREFLSFWKYLRWIIVIAIWAYFSSLHNNYVFYTQYDFPISFVVSNIVFRTIGIGITIWCFWFVQKKYNQLTKK